MNSIARSTRRALPRVPRPGERADGAGTHRRAGATLTEVLMSLLIMGLGITSVFTLFPMSVLRSVKATNLTHATLLAETARDSYMFRKQVLARLPARTLTPSSYYGYDKDVLLELTPAVPDAQIPEPFTGTYVVDPYGGINAGTFGNTPGRFGAVLRVANGMVVDDVTSDDSWITVFEDVPTIIANNTVSVPPPENNRVVTELSFSSGTDFNTSVIGGISTSRPSRCLVLSRDNRQSFTASVFPLGPVPNANTVRLIRQLPLTLFDPMNGVDNVGVVRVQNFERRYTYLYTMHVDDTGSTWGQIVVFFRREFGDSEQTYAITQIDTKNRKIVIDLGAGFSGRSPSGGDYLFGTWLSKPPPHPSQYVVNGRWYRIVGVSQQAPNVYELTLDRNWEGLTFSGNDPRVMLPGGVISVFDL